jgi:Winged helix-turn helix
MSARERMRLEALSRVKRQELTVVEAAELMAVSLRQARRLWKRFKAGGAGSLVHRLRGRVSNRRLPEEFRDQVVRRHQARYADFGPTLASEKLAEEGLVVSPDTLVTILQERHLWRRQRKAGRHRKCRERQAHFGQMVQMDGSHHDWFEGRGASKTWCVLMVIVDDATGQTYARFYPAETTQAAFDVLGRWIGIHGVPRKVYVDRHGIYRSEEALDGAYPPTQFGRAMQTLGTELILAKSPQAKGRVERKHRVFQDRLVKELRLRGISDMEQANILLEKVLLPELNGRYAIKPRRTADLHRRAPAELQEILCVQEVRVVGQDWCVRWKNRWLQIESTGQSRHLAGKQVLVKELAGGKLLVLRNNQPLAFKELAWRPRIKPAQAPPPQINNRRWKPGPDHPYNRQGRVDKFFRGQGTLRPPPAAAFLGRG